MMDPVVVRAKQGTPCVGDRGWLRPRQGMLPGDGIEQVRSPGIMLSGPRCNRRVVPDVTGVECPL
jgi:hypothetical protein